MSRFLAMLFTVLGGAALWQYLRPKPAPEPKPVCPPNAENVAKAQLAVECSRLILATQFTDTVEVECARLILAADTLEDLGFALMHLDADALLRLHKYLASDLHDLNLGSN